MKTSESIVNIAKALVEFQKDLPDIERNAVNPYFESNYATLDNILLTVRPNLIRAGLSIVQAVSTIPDRLGVIVETRLLHSSGEWIQESFEAKAESNAPQKIASTVTYLRRYSVTSFLGLHPEEDDDANATKEASSNFNQNKKNEIGSQNKTGVIPPKQVITPKKPEPVVPENLPTEKSPDEDPGEYVMRTGPWVNHKLKERTKEAVRGWIDYMDKNAERQWTQEELEAYEYMKRYVGDFK